MEVQEIQAACGANDPFKTNTGVIAQLAVIADDYTDYTEKRNKHLTEAATLAEQTLRDSIAELAPILQKIAQGDRGLLALTGFKLRKIPEAVTTKPIPPVNGKGVSEPAHSTEAILSCDPIPHATSYDAQVALNEAGPYKFAENALHRTNPANQILRPDLRPQHRREGRLLCAIPVHGVLGRMKAEE